MSEFQNVQRGNIFLWFILTLTFTIFIIIKLIKNQIDFKDGVDEQKYRQGQKNQKGKPEATSESMEAFDQMAIKQDKAAQDDTVIQRWLKRLHELQVYFLPIMFPFALNIVIGTSYAFLMVIFFFSFFFILLFNMWKVHRQCVQHPVLRILLESLGYLLSFFMLLNVWPTSTNSMPYVIVKG